MGSNIKNRIILDILIFFSIALFPWWITVVFVLFGFFIFKSFYEGVFAGFIIDSLYGTSRILFANLSFVSLSIFLILFIFVEWLKKRLRI